MKSPKLKNSFLVLFLLILFCSKEVEDPLADIDSLIETEKYESAREKLKERLSSKRKEDTILAEGNPNLKRIFSLSNDRNRVAWIQEKTIYFQDFANPLFKTFNFPQTLANLNLSTEGDFAVVSALLPHGAGCRMILISFLETRKSYVSSSYVSCANLNGVSSDGNFIYYFIDDNLYMESTTEPKFQKLLIDKTHFPYPYQNITRKYFIYPTGKTFIILYGNGGHYNAVWFDAIKHRTEKLLEGVASSKICYGNGKNLFLITGEIGNNFLKEIKFSYNSKPSVVQEFSINFSLQNFQVLSTQNLFVSQYNGQLFEWGIGKQKKALPLLTENFLIVARDQILYEDKQKNLILTNYFFTEEDWKMLDLYKMIKNRKEDD